MHIHIPTLYRYLVGPDAKRKINIVSGDNFTRANKILKAQVGKWLKDNGTETTSYEPISEADMKLLRTLFDEVSE